MRMCLHPQIQLVKLLRVNIAWSTGEQALPLLCLWECNHIANIVRACQKHNKSVQTQCDSAMGRCTIFESFEEKSESRLGLLPRNIQHALLERRKSVVPQGVGIFNTATAVSASNATVIDAEGRELIDFAGGIGVLKNW